MTMLGGVETLQDSTDLLQYPSNAQMVAILDNGTQLTGNAVMQGTSLGWRQATLHFFLDDFNDVAIIRGYSETHAEVLYVDHLEVTHSVRLLTLGVSMQGNRLWDCTAQVVETEAFFSYS